MRATAKMFLNNCWFDIFGGGVLKVNESRYIVLFVFSGCNKKLFSVVSIFIFSQYFFSIGFA